MKRMKKFRGYIKTNHFQIRQYERNVKEEILSEALRKISTPIGKTLIVISRKIVRKYCPKIRKELFIKVDNRILITCFYSEFQDYLQAKKKQNYLIIN
jgi:hypothetical protein